MPWQETHPVLERHHFAQDLDSRQWTMTELCLRYGIWRGTAFPLLLVIRPPLIFAACFLTGRSFSLPRAFLPLFFMTQLLSITLVLGYGPAPARVSVTLVSPRCQTAS